MTANAPDTIVLVHGLWLTPLAWEGWIDRFTQRGYRVLAPGWPGVERGVEALRRDPSGLADLGVAQIADHYERLIRGLDRPPIIMGHSFGGLITLLLLDRGLGAAGVSIATAPPKGILILPFSSLKVAFPALSNPLNVHKAVALTEEQFRYAFGNTLTEAESAAAYARYAIPGPDHVLFQAALANLNPHAATTVDFDNPNRAPLLLAAGEHDHVSPPALVKDVLGLYRKAKAPDPTDYREFAGRSHFLCGERGWEEVADAALDWATAHARATSPA